MYRLQSACACGSPAPGAILRTRDARAGQSAKELFAQARRAETSYATSLRKIARIIGMIVRDLANDSPHYVAEITRALRAYAEALTPWARAAAGRMVAEVAARDKRAWFAVSKTIGRELRREIESTPLGELTRKIQQEQVTLITSLPLEAAERVQALALEAYETGGRFPSIAEAILKTEAVTKARATLIARTEVAKAGTAITEARALHIGSTQYIWRTVGDLNVRPDHQKLNGKAFEWARPPIADARTGARAHAGAIYNCRCVCEPIIPV